MKRKIMIIILSCIAVLLSSCQSSGNSANSENSINGVNDLNGAKGTDVTKQEGYVITDINIYKDTPVWELALAVKKQKVKTIEQIAKDNPELLNYQDPKYGATLLLWSVGMEKYKSAEALLKSGANPNIASTEQGETPLFIAAGYSWVDNDAKKDPKYVKLLLSYGADTEKGYIGKADGNSIIELGKSPLMHSILSGIEKTKALVEGGADINYKT